MVVTPNSLKYNNNSNCKNLEANKQETPTDNNQNYITLTHDKNYTNKIYKNI